MSLYAGTPEQAAQAFVARFGGRTNGAGVVTAADGRPVYPVLIPMENWGDVAGGKTVNTAVTASGYTAQVLPPPPPPSPNPVLLALSPVLMPLYEVGRGINLATGGKGDDYFTTVTQRTGDPKNVSNTVATVSFLDKNTLRPQLPVLNAYTPAALNDAAKAAANLADALIPTWLKWVAGGALALGGIVVYKEVTR